MHRGQFITFEGGEGSGKSTQARMLAAALDDWGYDALLTREPGGTPGAEAIRELIVSGDVDRWDPLTEVMLISAARRDHVERLIRPALADGVWVICDRFADSTRAYQGYGEGLALDVIEYLYAASVGDLAPDLTIVQDLPVDDGLRRAAARDGDEMGRFEQFDRDFHRRLREGFLDIANNEPARCAVIDASAAPDDIHAAILAVVRDRLGAGPSEKPGPSEEPGPSDK
ncbi:MAG: dTMP kinase [Alphaproteobacteria bacterium]